MVAVSTNVTVLGAGGTTVTIPFSSAANAAAAQSALNIINLAVSVGLMSQQNFTGSASISSPTAPFPLTGAVVLSPVTVAGANSALPFGAIDLIDNSTPGPVNVIGPSNVITVVGAGGLTFVNQSQNATVFLTNGGNKYFALKDGVGATVNVDSGKNLIWDYGTGGSTTVNAYDGSSMLIARGNPGGTGGGNVSVNALAGIESIEQATYNPSTTVPALTITGAAGSNVTYYADLGTRAFIDPGAGNITVIGSGSTGSNGGGSVTLFGGNATLGAGTAFTGSANVVAGDGYFAGGTAGGNILQTDTGIGAATLIGGGSGDQLFAFGAKDLLIAGAGSETLIGTNSTTVGGSYFQTGGGNATVFGNALGGNSLFLGNGITNVIGSRGDLGGTGSVAGAHALANLYSIAADGGTDIISDFQSVVDAKGVNDQFSLTNSVDGKSQTLGAITHYTAGDGNTVFGNLTGTQVVVTDSSNSTSTTIYFYNSNVTKADFS